MSEWWTLDDVAAQLGVKQSTLRAYVARDQMPQPDCRFGRRWLWRPETIQQWSAQRGRKRDS